MNPPRICLDARFIPGERGGVEQTTLGLATGLSQLTDGDEEYYFLIYAGAEDWIKPYLSGACHSLSGPIAPRPALHSAGPLRTFVRWFWHRVSPILGARSVRLPRSDNTIDRAQIDLMHFTTQTGFQTDIPSMYQPWDLQHVHLPQFFTPRERLVRDITYRVYCERAERVIVPSRWGKCDLINHYNLPASKIAVIPAAPALPVTPPTNSDCDAIRLQFNLPDAFVLYPAQTWAHKNHLSLLDALTSLRDERQCEVPLICTGTLNEFFPTIQRRLRELHLDRQVKFLGYVSPLVLRCLYQMCRALIFPTKFEGFGLPILEAFSVGVPVACSAVTCLPEIADGAALLFNPDIPTEIASTLFRLWTDAPLRQELEERGYVVAARYSWSNVAHTFRAHYRQLLHIPLTSDDRNFLLASDFTGECAQ